MPLIFPFQVSLQACSAGPPFVFGAPFWTTFFFLPGPFSSRFFLSWTRSSQRRSFLFLPPFGDQGVFLLLCAFLGVLCKPSLALPIFFLLPPLFSNSNPAQLVKEYGKVMQVMFKGTLSHFHYIFVPLFMLIFIVNINITMLH